jgi:hypothetical protein
MEFEKMSKDQLISILNLVKSDLDMLIKESKVSSKRYQESSKSESFPYAYQVGYLQGRIKTVQSTLGINEDED